MAISYTETNAHVILDRLKENPFDLTGTDGLSPKRIEKYICKSGFFSLHYWSQRIDDEVLDGLQQLADECELVRQFIQMKSGKVMNAIHGYESEKRQVLHTASRDIFTDSPNEPEATKKTDIQLAKLKEFLDDIDSGKIVNGNGESFTTIIHIGIGGSDLGPRAIYEALKCYRKKGREAYFIANVDPDDVAATLRLLDIERALVTVVSKSGSTLETLSNESFVRDYFIEKGLDPKFHFVGVTGEGSPMDDPSKYLRSFYMYDYIGGRYSTTSMVGGVTLGFCLGYDSFTEFLKGASDVDYLAETADIRKNPALLSALLGLWNHSYLDLASVAVLPYSQPLHRFPAHLQQCDMESNGKSVNRLGENIEYKSGPIIWGEPGTNGQHAFYQLLHQGTEIVACEFIGFRKSQFEEDIEIKGTTSQQKLVANMLAQAVALARGDKSSNPNKHFSGNRPSSILLADKLTPEVMGGLLALYEAKIVFQGFAWNINSFDQEGVQLGKVLATRFLQEMGGAEDNDRSLEKSILKSVGI